MYNKDFDFIEFASNIIKTVDSIRSKSKTGTMPNSLPMESRINAFYRAIGLPAISRTEPKNRNNGNFIPTTATLIAKIDELEKRENVSLTLINLIEQAGGGVFDCNESSIADSIDETKRSIRPQLFPMFVWDEIEINSLDRRVSGAFATDAFRKIDKTELHIPFIEFLISLRLKESGVYNQSTQNNLSDQIYGEFAAVSSDLKTELTTSLKNIGEHLTDIRDRINKARIDTSTQVTPDPAGHSEQNTNTEDNSNPAAKATQDKQQQDQERDIAIKEARLLLFNFDDTTIDGAIENQNGQISAVTRNLKKSILASQFLNLSLSDAGAIASAKKETDSKKGKSVAELKLAGGQLDLLLGTYSGLSGTDVMAIIYALFTININTLMALLNDESRKRLDDTFNSKLSAGLKTQTQESAITELETKVKDIIETILLPIVNDDRQQNRKK